MSSENTVESPPEDLPKETIIIVGCVCGSIVLILLIILIVLCFRRHQAKKNEPAEQRPQSIPTQPVRSGKTGSGLDNPAMDDVDFDDPSRGGVFVTDTSITDPNYAVYGGRQRNGHLQNGYPHHMERPNGNLSSDLPPSYNDLDMKPTAPEVEYSTPHKHKKKDMTHLEPPDQDNSDSGVSTPDPVVKPKKVIYEVIV